MPMKDANFHGRVFRNYNRKWGARYTAIYQDETAFWAVFMYVSRRALDGVRLRVGGAWGVPFLGINLVGLVRIFHQSR